MDWETVLKIVGGLAALGGTAVAIGKFLSKQERSLKLLQEEIRDLKGRSKAALLPEVAAAQSTYEQLLSTSTEAARAVGAAFHSISVAVPISAPTDLKIILSTDPNAEKVLGREFPINRGLAGWVYQRRQPSFKNPGEVDQRYFELVDKAAGTKTGEGAILTMPLTFGGVCRGVIQFMKPRSGRFDESDVEIASRLLPSISRLVVELEDSPKADIPSVAHGNTRVATVLFSDIVGFSEIANKMRLEDAVAMLNEYYSRLLPHITARGGKLEEYVGDGIYASFSRESAAKAAEAAVLAAFSMHDEYRSMLEGWKAYQHPVSDGNTHAIGIATSAVYLGVLGHPQDRRTKIVGAAVNNAAHLCTSAKSTGEAVLLCSRTKELIDNGSFSFAEGKFSGGACFSARPGRSTVSRVVAATTARQP